MLREYGPVIVGLGSFGAGVLASLTSPVRAAVQPTVAVFGATAATSWWRRVALSSSFALGLLVLFTPLGIVAGIGGYSFGYVFWSTVSVVVAALLFAGSAASMFGAFALRLPRALEKKFAAVGGPSARGAFAMGLVAPFLAAPTVLPFVVGLTTIVVVTGDRSIGGMAFGSFALGLGAVFLFAGITPARSVPPRDDLLPLTTTWLAGVALAYLAFATLRWRFPDLDALVRNPRWEPGLVAAAVLLVGIAFAVVHIAAERRGARIAHLSKQMRLASIAPAVVGATLFFGWLPHVHGNAPPVAWVTDEVQGSAMARLQGKPAVVVFNAGWCCREVEATLFADPRVREEAARFIAIAVDATDDEDPETRRLAAKYRVLGLPEIILLDRERREVTRITSTVDPAVLLEAMRSVPSGDSASASR